MMMPKAWLPVIFIIALVAACGCARDDKTPGDSLPVDQYVAVEEYQKTTCTLINGSYDLPPHITLPPVFIYDGSKKGNDPVSHTGWELSEGADLYYPEVNDSFKVLLGMTYYRDVAPRDTLTGVTVNGVYGFPYTGQSGFVLQNVDRNGTVYGTYGNTSIVLRAGERWYTPPATEIKSGNGTGLDQKPFGYTAIYNMTWTIANLGMFKKANLTQYNNSAVGPVKR